MTYKNLVLDEYTFAAVYGPKCKIATRDATLAVQQAAKTSKLSSWVAKIVEMLVSRSIKTDELYNKSAANPQQIVQAELGLYDFLRL